MDSDDTEPTDEEEFGPTIGIHKEVMGVVWGLGANVAILLAYYSYRKIWSYVHGSFFLFAIIITLASSIPIITTAGVIQDQIKVTAHFIIGIICFSAAIAVGILGILTKVLNLCQAKSNTILLVKKIHLISGYIVVSICKINLYIMSLGWIVQDVAFMAIFIIWKLYFPKMEGRFISPKIQADLDVKSHRSIKGIQSIKELGPEKSYVIFANYVYDTDPLKYYHPAGYQVIDMVKNRDVDRFIYGSEVPAELPQVPMWSHSYKSFTLMNAPIARLSIAPTFHGFDTPEVECKIPQIRLISEKGSIHQMNLIKKEGSFTFLKYKDLSQIGRYFTITLNDKVTRSYTTVNFLVEENLIFLQKHLRLDGVSGKVIKIKEQTENQLDVQMQDSARFGLGSTANSIPILFKVYPNGRFTQAIVNGPVNKIVLSQSKGEGLELPHTKPGKIIMVIGGTGLYPFSDLIDLLYKEQLIQLYPSSRDDVLSISPILEKNPFAAFKFDILAAFGHVQDIHSITLQQLLFLSDNGRINLTLKFKENPWGKIKENAHLSFTNTDFCKILGQKLRKEPISKVWICGPSKMNQGVSKFLRDTYDKYEQYLIV